MSNIAVAEGDRASRGYLISHAASASLCYLGDVARRWPAARGLQDIPTSPRQLSTEWLTAALCGDIAGAKVTDFEVPLQHSGTSSRFAIHVGYNRIGEDAGLQPHLFAKTTRTYQQRIFLGLANVLAGESIFFTQLRPYLDIEAPQGYHGHYNERSFRSICLMEDVAKTKGATFAEPTDPISRTEIEDVLENLAVLHGQFWNSPQLHAAGLRDTYRIVNWTDSLAGFRARSHVGVKRAASVIPRQIVERTDEIFDGVLQSLFLDRGKPHTLLHGDPHGGQLYRTRDGRMGLCDWQALMRGRWVHDFAYTVHSSVAVEDRQNWDRHLLDFYLERLAKAGGEAPEFNDAWLEYRQHAFYTYIAWVFTIGRAAYQPKYQPDEYSLAIIERAANAIVDLDAFGALR